MGIQSVLLSVAVFAVAGQAQDICSSGLPVAEGVCSNGGEIPGTAGVDYPVYAEVPSTNFHCGNIGVPGYYADPESGCQAFYVCGRQGKGTGFLCPNGTLFNQEVLVCDWWTHVDCNQAVNYYGINQQIQAEMEAANERLGVNQRERERLAAAGVNPNSFGAPNPFNTNPFDRRNPSIGANGPFSGRNPYNPNSPFNVNRPFGPNTPFGQNTPFGPNGNPNRPFGQNGNPNTPFGQNTPFGPNGNPNSPFGQNTPFGPNGTPNRPFGQNVNPNTPFGQNTPFGPNGNPNSPFGQNTPFGQNVNPNSPFGQNPNAPLNQNRPLGPNGPFVSRNPTPNPYQPTTPNSFNSFRPTPGPFVNPRFPQANPPFNRFPSTPAPPFNPFGPSTPGPLPNPSGPLPDALLNPAQNQQFSNPPQFAPNSQRGPNSFNTTPFGFPNGPSTPGLFPNSPFATTPRPTSFTPTPTYPSTIGSSNVEISSTSRPGTFDPSGLNDESQTSQGGLPSSTPYTPTQPGSGYSYPKPNGQFPVSQPDREYLPPFRK